jgi:hypothetical protein
MRRGLKVMKRSGRDELIWVVYTSAWKQGWESLYSYLYLKLAKMLYLFYYLLCFLFNKIEEYKRAEQVLPRSRGWRARRKGANNVYTYESM